MTRPLTALAVVCFCLTAALSFTFVWLLGLSMEVSELRAEVAEMRRAGR